MHRRFFGAQKRDAAKEVPLGSSRATESRAAGLIGSSLQANVSLLLPPPELDLLRALGEDLKFVFITSAIALAAGETLSTVVTPSAAQKCERCWHYRDDVGHDAAHPTICGRCTSNLFGAGESRSFA